MLNQVKWGVSWQICKCEGKRSMLMKVKPEFCEEVGYCQKLVKWVAITGSKQGRKHLKSSMESRNDNLESVNSLY